MSQKKLSDCREMLLSLTMNNGRSFLAAHPLTGTGFLLTLASVEGLFQKLVKEGIFSFSGSMNLEIVLFLDNFVS
jgi:hypothetical protein